jgi:DnaJ family protein B protein 4
MSRDYYAILGVSKNATKEEIKRSYKKMALLYHPDRNTGNQEQATKKFKEVGEAYEVLSDPQKRAIYDRYGEAGLKRGSGNAGSESPFGSGFQYYSSNHPFQDTFFEEMFRGFGHRTRRQSPSIEKVIPLTLEELYLGAMKRVKVTKTILNEEVTEIIPVEIAPGYREGMKLEFKGRGNEMSGMAVGDIVFIISEKPHAFFKREKQDLHYNASISIKHALLGLTLNITMLNGVETRVDIAGPIDPSYVHVEKGYGMPLLNGYGHGSLYIHFTYLFPKNPLSAEKKKEIEKVFNDVEFARSGNGIVDIVSNSISKWLKGAAGYLNFFFMFFLFWYFLSLSGSGNRIGR